MYKRWLAKLRRAIVSFFVPVFALLFSVLFPLLGCPPGSGPQLYAHDLGENYKSSFGASYGTNSCIDTNQQYAAAYDLGYDEGYCGYDDIKSSAEHALQYCHASLIRKAPLCSSCGSLGGLYDGFQDGFFDGCIDSPGDDYSRTKNGHYGRRTTLRTWLDPVDPRDKGYRFAYKQGYVDGCDGQAYDDTYFRQALANSAASVRKGSELEPASEMNYGASVPYPDLGHKLQGYDDQGRRI